MSQASESGRGTKEVAQMPGWVRWKRGVVGALRKPVSVLSVIRIPPPPPPPLLGESVTTSLSRRRIIGAEASSADSAVDGAVVVEIAEEKKRSMKGRVEGNSLVRTRRSVRRLLDS